MITLSFRNVSDALPVLSDMLLRQAPQESRAGEVREKLFTTIVLENPLERDIIHPERKASPVAQMVETAWVLAARSEIKDIEPYLPRAAEFSDDGVTWRAGYGTRIRRWEGRNFSIDQLGNIVKLLRKDPNTRRAVISIFDPGSDITDSKDIPCNNWLHFIAREGKLNLHVATRSNDLVWGWSGINQFEWSVLLEIVAKLTGFQVGVVQYSVSSFHAYTRHDKRLERMGARNVDPDNSSLRAGFTPKERSVGHLDFLLSRWWDLENRIRNESPRLGAPRKGHKEWPLDRLIDDFPEPMLRSWLYAIRWYWTGVEEYLEPLRGTDLYTALRVGVTPPPHRAAAEKVTKAQEARDGDRERLNHRQAFAQKTAQLHERKHEAYGDSWKRRGEMLSILPNIARKVDRLGKTDDDETAADTAVDLLVYLVKYRWWLVNEADAPLPSGWAGSDINYSNDVEAVRLALTRIAYGTSAYEGLHPESAESIMQYSFENFLASFGGNSTPADAPDRYRWVDAAMLFAFELALVRDNQLNVDPDAAAQQWKAANEKRAWRGYEEN